MGASAAFWVLAGMGAGMLATLAVVPGGSVPPSAPGGSASLWQILADRRVLALCLALALFHLGNAAMLPLLGQRMATIGQGDATRWLAACVVVAQVAMVPVALAASWAADNADRAWLLLAACAVLPVRGVIAAFGTDPLWLIPVQMLDACGAGTLGVAVPVLVADYTWGSGRTQTVIGIAMTFQGIGAALSATLGGLLAEHLGWEAAFLGLAVPAIGAAALSAGLLAPGRPVRGRH